jgi:hypothetical protein
MTVNQTNLFKSLVAIALVAMCVVGRLVEHEPNFTPLAATALFAGFFFSRWWAAAGVTLSAMLISDAFVGFYEPRTMALVYIAMLIPIAMRGLLRSRLTVTRVAAGSLVGSTAFFIATNAAHFLFFGGYDPSWSGLVACYVAAIPFFRNTLTGDLFYSAILFGMYASVVCLAGRTAVKANHATVRA